MFKIRLNSIKNRVRLFFAINIALVVVNYYLTYIANNSAESDRQLVEVSKENEYFIEKLSYITKAIVEAREKSLRKELQLDMETYNANLEALKSGGQATIGEDLVQIKAPDRGKQELKSLEDNWKILKGQLQVILEKQIEVDTFSYEAQDLKDSLILGQDNDTLPRTKRDSLGVATQKRDSARITAANQTENPETVYYERKTNPEVEKVYYLSKTTREDVLNRNKELSEVYEEGFTNSQTYLQSVLLITFLLNLFVLVGGTFVIGTYLINPLKNIATTAKDVATGDVNTQVVYDRKDEIGEVSDSLNLIVGSFKEYTEFAENIGTGNFDFPFEVKSDKDTLGYALLGMRNNLKAVAEDDSKRNWANEGFTLFSNLLRSSDQDIEEFSYLIISNLVKYLDANQGGLFILNEEEKEPVLEMKAAFAYNKRKFEDKRVAIGQGLLGQVVLEKNIIYLDEVPTEYIQITSGLGRANPRSLLIAPLRMNEEVYGAVEIASFNYFEPYQIDFVEKLAENIASTLATVRTNENTKRLLNETRQYAEQMQAQEEEMRQNMEELASTQEEMEKNQQRLDEYRRNLEREVETRTTELKDKESKLAQAISQLQGIIDSGRAGIVALDTNYKIVAANQQSRELIRKLYNTEFEIGQNWFKIFLQEDDRIQAKKLWDRTLGGNHFIHEDKYTDSNGHTTWLEIAFNPILDENKAIIGASMFARDITERKREVKNIQLTANILDNSSSEVYIFNALDLRFVNVNERGRQNLGYTIDELQGLTPCELMLDFSKTEFENFIFPLKAKEIQYLTLESAHRRKDGSSYETALNFQYFEDQDTPLFAAIAQDITERKQNELQLTEALARFNLATAATKEGIWEMSVVATAPINPDNPAWWSRQFKALLGLEQEDFPERLDSWSVRIHPDDREKVLRALYEHLMDITGKTPFQIEYRLMTKGGGYEWFSGSGETLRDIQGNPLKIAGSLRNINRRKKAEDELMEKTAIVNGILNAAVNSIISMDKEDIILTINPATEKMFGYTVDELIGKPIGILLANPEINIKQFTDAVHEIEGKTKEGVIFPLDVSISASEVGDKMIYVGILRTISSRQRG